MYVSCASYLWRERKQRKNSMYMLAYITLGLAVQTTFCAAHVRTVELAFVDNRDYPGGPWQYFLSTQSQPIGVMWYATFVLTTLLSDFLVVS